jgi:hypothetical protein
MIVPGLLHNGGLGSSGVMGDGSVQMGSESPHQTHERDTLVILGPPMSKKST